ncbi:VOC family protein [Candidatus Falkowbacteria bacterium]|nr:VOC family protein [Candidatus Falkowbacteria bacterium]
MNTIEYFEIQADKPSKLLDFYKKIFGWTFIREENVPLEYYRIETGGIRGGLLKRPVMTPPMEYGTNAFTCSVMVNDFDLIADKIIKEGGIVAMPKFAIPGRCWQGYFVDLDHNVFGIFEPDEKAA